MRGCCEIGGLEGRRGRGLERARRRGRGGGVHLLAIRGEEVELRAPGGRGLLFRRVRIVVAVLRGGLLFGEPARIDTPHGAQQQQQSHRDEGPGLKKAPQSARSVAWRTQPWREDAPTVTQCSLLSGSRYAGALTLTTCRLTFYPEGIVKLQ